jgi:hypothetical protein
MSDEPEQTYVIGECPTCGAELHDFRGTGFNIHQAGEAGLCVYLGDMGYVCSQKQRERDSRALSPRQLRDTANRPWEDE